MNTTLIAASFAVAAVSYLLGSFNFAMIVSKLLGKDDVRRHGSGNAGMTNMLRTYGKGPAIITAAGDFLKAVAAVFLSRVIFALLRVEFADAGYIAGIFVMFGHIYPLYFGFRGGKGVMTTLGIIAAVNPFVFLVIAVIFTPLVFITRIVSLCSVLGAISYPILTCVFDLLFKRPALYDTIFAAVYACIVVFTHRENIKRLLNGTENKFGKKK